MKIQLIFILIAILTLISRISFSQKEITKEIEKITPVITNVNETPVIQRDYELEKKINQQRLLGNTSASESLQNELAGKYNIGRDKSEIKIVEPVKGNLFNNTETDSGNETHITMIDSVSYISIQSAVSEQTGNTKGRLWNIYMISTYTKDTIRLMYSDDNGINWNHFASYIWAYPDFDTYAMNMDAEIVINNLNEKMLYIVFPCYNGSDQRMGIVRVNAGLNPGLCSQQLFNFGSFSTTLQYRNAKVTSDNAVYPSLPYVFISAYEFNTYYGNYLVRFAMISNPFDLYGNIQYSNAPILHSSESSMFDFCSYNIGFNDYVFFAVITSSGSNDLYTIQYNIYDAIVGNEIHVTSQFYVNKPIRLPTVASDGSKFVVACEYEFNSGDYDIKSFYSPGGGILQLSDYGFIDNSVLFDAAPSVTAKWNSGKFSCSYNKRNFSGYNSIVLASTNTNPFDTKSKMISTDEISTFSPLSIPIPVITNNDECFVTWIDDGYDQQVYSATGCSGIIERTKTLNMKLFLQGFYRQNTNQMVLNDTVKVYLRKYNSPYNIIDSAVGPINKSGNVSLNFRNAENNINYFIVARHRNSIETWSDPDGVMFTGDMLNFDFSVSNGHAYGANQTQVDQIPIVYAIFSGDVNQDRIVDLSDVLNIYNDANTFTSGYKVTDLTGDNFTDLTDILIAYNNSAAFVTVLRP